MKRTMLSFIVLTVSQLMSAQGFVADWNASLRMAASSGEFMPFWARTGEDGILPYTSSALLTAGGKAGYYARSGLFCEAGVNLAGALAAPDRYGSGGVTGIVDRLYVSAGWKVIRLDVGMVPREKTLGDLSISGGDVLYSGNARNLPGINLRTDGWLYFEKGHWVGVKANFAHYEMNDNRWIKGTKLHNKSVELKVAAGRKVDIMAGIHHYCQWGGVSPTLGRRPSSFRDFLRIIAAKEGGSSATMSDQLNALGNHIGREFARVDWRTKKVTVVLQYDLLFEDGRGIIKSQGFPDGIWSLGFEMTDKDAFVNNIMLEFIHTSWQSGPIHDRPATEEELPYLDPDDWYGSRGLVCEGGRDNYFCHGEYVSGWTYHNRVIGLPLMTVAAPDENGITKGFVNNRVRAYHIGIGGNIIKSLPYVFRSTFSKNLGRYGDSETSFFASGPWQLSLGLDLDLKFLSKYLPYVDISAGLFGDVGKLYHNCAGLTLRFNYCGSIRR